MRTGMFGAEEANWHLGEDDDAETPRPPLPTGTQ